MEILTFRLLVACGIIFLIMFLLITILNLVQGKLLIESALFALKWTLAIYVIVIIGCVMIIGLFWLSSWVNDAIPVKGNI
ncbi:hypothetical protein [Lacrimispora sp. 38-1]|uniref:hypothetical protein n=1 Tax=Lacrimispora sp. 38-1 TaxID=3125778 RepID=UPI003CE9E11B